MLSDSVVGVGSVLLVPPALFEAEGELFCSL